MNRIYPLFFMILFLFSCSEIKFPKEQREPVSHELWDQFLQEHVDTNGGVSYKAIVQDPGVLESYLDLLSSSHPNDSWTRNERLAYWINAYNAFTVKHIVDHYPLESIKDIKKGIPFVNSVWDMEFIQIQDQPYTLNDIEHQILRKRFNEPRIHFAINCASYSCPLLSYEAYTATNVETKLEKAAFEFINDSRRNKVSEDSMQVSRIFLWFGKDFKVEGKGVKDYINQYATEKAGEDTKVDYLPYDWSLNEKAGYSI